MPKYITYELRALENLKLTKTNMQIDVHESMNYIGGSAIRGAYIYKYIRANKGIDINQGEHREKLLSGGIKFMNAYPKGKSTIPLPKCYFAPKSSMKVFDKEMDITLGLDISLAPGYEKVRLSEFVSVNNEEFTIVKVNKTSNLHIKKNHDNKGDKNKLFRYESIKEGQVFSGMIKAEKDEYADEVIKLLKDKIIYIGGSKGSGYGKCIIVDMRISNENPYGAIFSINPESESIYILTLSDIIYRDKLGNYSTKLGEEFIEGYLGLDKVEFVDSSIETKSITTFNNKWNARTPNIVAIKAGSIFKYRIYGELDISLIDCLVDNGIGERKIDGFGRIAVITDMNFNKIKSESLINEASTKDNNLSKDEINLLNNMGTKIYKKRVESKINEIVLELSSQFIDTRKLKLSQWGSLKNLFIYLSTLDIEEGIKTFNEHMDHIEGKRGKSYHSMERVKYVGDNGNKSLREFLKDHMSDITNRNTFVNRFRDCKIEIEEINIEIDDAFIYWANLRILVELCRYEIRKEAK